jgi:hypothetical protein
MEPREPTGRREWRADLASDRQVVIRRADDGTAPSGHWSEAKPRRAAPDGALSGREEAAASAAASSFALWC